MSTLKLCTLCPRQCKADRTKTTGYCLGGKDIKIARADFHEWEEPCICYNRGAGAIFFSGCSLKCVYCQNYEISELGKGYIISKDELKEKILEFAHNGASCIDLVNPTHYISDIKEVLFDIKEKINIPVVYNTGCYDKRESLEELSGLIDIYLPDFKYFSSVLSKSYSSAEDYFSVASTALQEMYRQCGYAKYDKDKRMIKGVLTRHLVLPSHRDDSKKILDYLSQNYDASKFALSLMSQYFPTHKAKEYKSISRKLTTFEYQDVVEYAYNKGFENCYIQDRKSSDSKYVPQFFDNKID